MLHAACVLCLKGYTHTLRSVFLLFFSCVFSRLRLLYATQLPYGAGKQLESERFGYEHHNYCTVFATGVLGWQPQSMLALLC